MGKIFEKVIQFMKKKPKLKASLISNQENAY